MNEREQEILKFIGSLQGYEIKFVEDIIGIARNFRKYIEEVGDKFDVKEFCSQVKIQEKDFNKFVSGEWNYSLCEISMLEYLWTSLRRSKVNVNVVSVGDQTKPREITK